MGTITPRILRMTIGGQDAGKSIREYLMKSAGFSAREISRFKYRKNGICLNGVRRYVNTLLQEGDVLEIRLSQGTELSADGTCISEEEYCASPGGVCDSAGRACASPGGVCDSAGRACASPGGACDSAGRACASPGGVCDSPGGACAFPDGVCGPGEGERAFSQGPGIEKSASDHMARDGYRRARDGRLQKIWAPPAAWLNARHPLRILYEDADILVADKPSGVVCHPSPGHYDDTLSNQVAEHLGMTGKVLDVRVTGRLDMDTSGIVVFALNTETAAKLIRQREAEVMRKLYIARVQGHFEKSSPHDSGECREYTGAAGTIDIPLKRESSRSFLMVPAQDGKAARTHYQVLAELEDNTSLVACRIEHGRTHQIRVHMSFIGHPIVGDRLYGVMQAEGEAVPENTEPAVDPSAADDNAAGWRSYGRESCLMLHAWKTWMTQPFTGREIFAEAPLPAWAYALHE